FSLPADIFSHGFGTLAWIATTLAWRYTYPGSPKQFGLPHILYDIKRNPILFDMPLWLPCNAPFEPRLFLNQARLLLDTTLQLPTPIADRPSLGRRRRDSIRRFD